MSQTDLIPDSVPARREMLKLVRTRVNNLMGKHGTWEERKAEASKNGNFHRFQLRNHWIHEFEYLAWSLAWTDLDSRHRREVGELNEQQREAATLYDSSVTANTLTGRKKYHKA